MNETMKEKLIRFVLIGFFILVTIFAFFYRDVQFKEEKVQQPLGFVMKQSVQATENPIVALYEYKSNDHILAIYEIDKMNRYKFRTLHAVKLEKAPAQLSPDQKESGIWALTDGEWQYYNSNLKEEKRHVRYKSLRSPYEVQYEFDKRNSFLTINNNQSISLDVDSSPVSLHSLSADGGLWLILTKTNLKIAKLETK